MVMDAPDSRLAGPLGLVRWILWAQRKAADDWVKERDLSFEQGFVLGYLVQFPGAIQRDVAQLTGTTAASVTSLLQGLERRGLVQRRTEGGDARSKRVYATPAGATLVSGFEEAMAAVDEAMLAPLNESERSTLQELLKKITAQLPPPTRS
jgi:MarR family transcriptional regulator, repressor for mepA